MENVDDQDPQARTELVRGAHRAIRRLDDAQSPFAGDLVSDGERQRVRVPAADVDAALWEFAGAEHIAGVRDLLRDPDGHSALLPWCVEPVDVLLARRSEAGRPLTSGESVTLVGSLVRGIAEVAGRPVTGRWWLEDGGRPMFVPGEGASCAATAAGLVERVRDECADRSLLRVLSRIGAGMTDHRVVQRSLDTWEGDLTELAAPRALEREIPDDGRIPLAPERVRAVPFHRAGLAEVTGRLEKRRLVGERLTLAAAKVRGFLRRGLPTRGAVVGAAEAAARTRAPRGRMLLVGAGVAGLVLLGGLLWPGGEDAAVAPRADAADGRTEATPTAGPASAARRASQQSETADPSADVPPRAGGRQEGLEHDVERAATRLLKTMDGCRAQNDTACAAAIVAGAGQTVQGRLGADAAAREAGLIDDYGDVAVIRLARTSAVAEQVLVLVKQEDGWLVRDVYDVADQPSGEG